MATCRPGSAAGAGTGVTKGGKPSGGPNGGGGRPRLGNPGGTTPATGGIPNGGGGSPNGGGRLNVGAGTARGGCTSADREPGLGGGTPFGGSCCCCAGGRSDGSPLPAAAGGADPDEATVAAAGATACCSPPCAVLVGGLSAVSLSMLPVALCCDVNGALLLVTTGTGAAELMVEVTGDVAAAGVDAEVAATVPPGATPAAAAMLSICS